MRPLLCVAAVLLAQAATAEKILIGQLSTLAHSVSGEVYALDEKTLMIKDFNYDGAGDNTNAMVICVCPVWSQVTSTRSVLFENSAIKQKLLTSERPTPIKN